MSCRRWPNPQYSCTLNQTAAGIAVAKAAHSLASARRCQSFAHEGDPLTLRGSLREGWAPRAPEQNFRQRPAQRTRDQGRRDQIRVD